MILVTKKFYSTLISFKNENGTVRAAALSYYTLLSTIPVLILVVSLIGHWLARTDDLLFRITQIIESISPLIKEGVLENLQALISHPRSYGSSALFMLLGVSHVLFNHLDKLLHELLHIKQTRHFLMTRFFYLILLVVLSVMLALPSWALFAVRKIFIEESAYKSVLFFLEKGWFDLATFFTFFILMSLIPSKRLRLTNVFWGGLLFSILMELARQIFQWYSQFALERYHVIYGSLTIMMLALLWVFYFSNIFIYCILWIRNLEESQKDAKHNR